MSENEIVEDVVEVAAIQEVKDADGNDTTDWKALALKYNADAVKNQGIAQRFKTKVEKLKSAPPAPIEKKEEKKTGELDYGQKAYLKASGIEPTEFDFVKEQMASSGKDIDSLLSSGYFQAELKAKRDAKAVAAATPSATRSAEAPSESKVDFWIAKGELPPDMELRQKVVDRKYELAKQGRSFKS